MYDVPFVFGMLPVLVQPKVMSVTAVFENHSFFFTFGEDYASVSASPAEFEKT